MISTVNCLLDACFLMWEQIILIAAKPSISVRDIINSIPYNNEGLKSHFLLERLSTESIRIVLLIFCPTENVLPKPENFYQNMLILLIYFFFLKVVFHREL